VTSHASRRLLGDRATPFEHELRRRLGALEPSGIMSVRIALTALLAVKG
jgi:hypothetical protein